MWVHLLPGVCHRVDLTTASAARVAAHLDVLGNLSHETEYLDRFQAALGVLRRALMAKSSG